MKKAKKWLSIFLAIALVFTSVNLLGVQPVFDVEAASNGLDASGSYVFDSTSEWDNNDGKENIINYTTEDIPTPGTILELDVLLPDTDGAPDFSNIIKVVGVLRIGGDWDWIQSNTIPELTAEHFSDTVEIEGDTYYKASVEIPFEEKVGANVDGDWSGEASFEDVVTDTVSALTVQFAGYKCDYSGDICIANARLNTGEKIFKEWNFDSDAEGWEYFGWEWQYSGAGNTSVSGNDGKLEVSVDYSADGDKSYSKFVIGCEDDIAVKGANKLTYDFYYDPNLLDGDFKTSVIIQGSEDDIDKEALINTDDAVEAENGLKKVQVEVPFDPAIVGESCYKTAIAFIGVETTYTGSFYIDNVRIVEETSTGPDIYVDSTISANDLTGDISLSNDKKKIETFREDGTVEEISLPENITLVDGDADENVKATYAYLQAMGESDSVIFGQQNSTWHKAGAKALSDSDTRDIVDSISGVVGIDTLSLTGNEYRASRYNSEISEDTFPETAAGNVAAAAALTNKNIEEGAIITLSAHMPNFSIVEEDDKYNDASDPTYAKYNFEGYSPGNFEGDVMNEILPGGLYHEVYRAYLDMIADYAKQVEGTILFRPFHENTGSWFWWGKAFCDAQTYKNVWQYTVEYLRDDQGIHNMLYVYGPGSEAANAAEYGERYPGDDYVDMVGFDMYNRSPGEDNENTWFKEFEAQLKLVGDFADEHGKLIAVTETGVANETQAGHNQTALLPQGNAHKEWYQVMLDKVSDSSASFFLVWANFGEQDGFYTPYVKSVNEDGSLHGHELLDNFIDFYNDGRSIFAENQKEVLADLENNIEIDAEPTTTTASGYIVSPISGKRILKPTTIRAYVSRVPENGSVYFECIGKKTVSVNDVTHMGGKVYEASLTEDILAEMGESVGNIKLFVTNDDGDKELSSIKAVFNMPEPEEDPYQIDDFENYSGENTLLHNKWATNKETGCLIDISLTNEEDKYCSGEYGLKFAYDETETGWAGATIAKSVDWSDCNALQFWTIPDGNNQHVVIQITANGNTYEAYLEDYEGYCDSTEPMFVTIPFKEFVARDLTGKPKGGLVEDRDKVNSFGLWVNAVKGTAAMVDGRVQGTIYYDKITAIHTDAANTTFESLAIADISYESATAYFIPNITGNASYKVSASGETVISDNVDVTAGKTIQIPITGLKAGTKYTMSISIDNGLEKSISFTTKKDATTPPEPPKPTKPVNQAPFKISGIGSTLTFGQSATLKVSGGSGSGAVTYAVTTNGKYAKVDAKSGKVHATGIGTVTITATKAGDSKYNPAKASITFKTVMPKKGATITVGSSKYKVTSVKNKKETLAYAGPVDKQTRKVTIPATIKIGNKNYKVTAINKNALKGCKKLTSATIGKNVTSIGDSAFEGCTSLTKITIPANVKTIGKKAFYKDSKLKTITVKSKKVTKVGKNAFKGINKKATIKVPKAKKAAYKKLFKKGQPKTVTIR